MSRARCITGSVARELERRGVVARRLGPRGRCLPVGAYWWTGAKNFGDLLTPTLLPRVGVAPILRGPGEAELFGPGSVIHHVQPGFSGWVWGSGMCFGDGRKLHLDGARVHLVRGELTRQAGDLDDSVPLGDPGLLADELVTKRTIPAHPSRVERKNKHGIAVVGHIWHKDIPEFVQLRERIGGFKFIDAARNPGAVARDIASSQVVLTTSLHGLIFADGLGIPATWALPQPQVPGGDFKFHDHETVVGDSRCQDWRRCVISDIRGPDQLLGLARRANPDKVAQTKSVIQVTRRRLAEELAGHEMCSAALLLPSAGLPEQGCKAREAMTPDRIAG